MERSKNKNTGKGGERKKKEEGGRREEDKVASDRDQQAGDGVIMPPLITMSSGEERPSSSGVRPGPLSSKGEKRKKEEVKEKRGEGDAKGEEQKKKKKEEEEEMEEEEEGMEEEMDEEEMKRREEERRKKKEVLLKERMAKLARESERALRAKEDLIDGVARTIFRAVARDQKVEGLISLTGDEVREVSSAIVSLKEYIQGAHQRSLCDKEYARGLERELEAQRTERRRACEELERRPPPSQKVDASVQRDAEAMDAAVQTDEVAVHGGVDALLGRIGALMDGKVDCLRSELRKEFRAEKEKEEEVAPPRASKRRRGKGDGGKGGTQRGEMACEATIPPPPPRPAAPAPAAAGPPCGEAWSRVVGRRERGRERRALIAPPRAAPRPSGGAVPSVVGAERRRAGAALRPPPRCRVPATAAITISAVPGQEGGDVSGALVAARAEISPADWGIPEMTQRRSATGGMKYHVPGPDASAKADKLAEAMRECFARHGFQGVKVDRPVKLAEMRVVGLADADTPKQVAQALADAGACGGAEVTVGAITRSPRGLGSAWARMPVAAANKVAAAGKIRMGWMSIGVQLLGIRPMRCYRCLESGHSWQRCTSQEDRGGRCFRCGESGHLAKDCRAPAPRCPLCVDLGRRADHRLGAAACAPRRVGGMSGTGGGGVAAPHPPPLGGGRPGESPVPASLQEAGPHP